MENKELNTKYSKKAYFVLITLLIIALLQPRGGTWAYVLNIRWLYVIVLSFLISNLITPLCIKLSQKFAWYDIPDERKNHTVPIPRIGGLAIYVAVIIALMRNLAFSTQLAGLIIGGTLIFVLGLLDDIKGGLPAKLRLSVQTLAIAIVIIFGIKVSFIPHYFGFFKIPLEILITIIWITGIMNAVNFLDGIDGLVTSFGILCSLLFLLVALPTQQKYLAYISAAIVGAGIGFLPYNWQKAKIFLGDSGSTFIGYMLAGIAIMGSWAENNSTVAFSTPLLILSVPIFDMIYTTISRIKNGSVKTVKEWLEFVGKDHFHHRLQKIGLSVKATVGFIILVNLCLGLGALIIRDTGTKGSFILLVQAFGILTIVIVLMLVGRDIRD